MKTKGFLLCFTGIDGAGKTTLSKRLIKILNEKGFKCEYVYARLNPFILRPFILMGDQLFLRGKNVSKNYPAYCGTKREAINRHPFLSTIYQRILLLDYFLQIFVTVKLPVIFGRNIVCDRYVYDTVITDLAVDMNYSRDQVLDLINSLLRFFPKPDVTFLTDIPEEIAYSRKNDVPSIEYLKERRGVYLSIGKEYGMVVLDGSRTLEELQHEIEKELFQ